MDKRISDMDRDELIAFVKEAMAEYKKNNQIINTPASKKIFLFEESTTYKKFVIKLKKMLEKVQQV